MKFILYNMLVNENKYLFLRKLKKIELKKFLKVLSKNIYYFYRTEIKKK